jgi:hypothetical protein
MAKSNADRRSASSRRGRRRGGYPPGAAEPEAIPFEPTPVNEEGFTKWVIDQASELVPGAVDEVLGHALDNAINARVDQWVARLNIETTNVSFAKRLAMSSTGPVPFSLRGVALGYFDGAEITGLACGPRGPGQRESLPIERI